MAKLVVKQSAKAHGPLVFSTVDRDNDVAGKLNEECS